MLLKSERNFNSAPVNFIFEHMPCRFVLTQRIVPQGLLGIFFFKFYPEVLLSMTMLSMRINFGHHKENFVYVSMCQSEVRFLMLIVML